MDIFGQRKNQRQLLPCNDVFIVWFPKTVTYREILFNSPYWPSDVDEVLKMSYTKGTHVNLRISGKTVYGIVIWRGITSKLKTAITAIETLIEHAEDTAQLTDSLLNTNFDIRAVACTKRTLAAASSSESDSDSAIIELEKKRRTNYLKQAPVNSSSPIQLTSSGTISGDHHISNTLNILSEFASASCKQPDKVLGSESTTGDNQPVSVKTASSKIEICDNTTEVRQEILSYMKIIVKEVRNVSVQVKKLRTELNKDGGKVQIARVENDVADNTVFEDFLGNPFNLSCLYTFVEPNKFALKFIEKLCGTHFLQNHILEPNTESKKSKRISAPAHIVAHLKKALNCRFLNYDWQTVKKYLNQKGRDLKKATEPGKQT
jgi:hypothetical protein